MESNYRKKGSGGKRAGSGRPRVGKFTRSIFVTDTEHKKVLKFIAELRKAVK